jgi:hypothetical protein
VAVEEPAGSTADAGCPTVPVNSMPVAMQQGETNQKTHQYSIMLLTTHRSPRSRKRPSACTHNRTTRPALRSADRTNPDAIPAKTAPHLLPHPPEPTLLALDAQGRPIPSGAVRTLAERPKASGQATCALRANGLPGLTPQWSHFASAIEPYPGKLVGRVLLVCDTEYYLNHWPLDAVVLLDAAHPGTPPAAIPGLTPARESQASTTDQATSTAN